MIARAIIFYVGIWLVLIAATQTVEPTSTTPGSIADLTLHGKFSK
jgi:hypothetical protein